MTPITLQTASGSIRLTHLGAEITGDVTQEEWTEYMRSMKQVKTVFHRALADVVSYGRRAFGKKVVDDTMEQLSFDLQDYNRATALGDLSQTVRENAQLTSEQAYVIGRELDNPDDQARWAEIATKERLNAADLRLSISLGTVKRSRDRDSGIPSFEAVVAAWTRTVRHFPPEGLSRAQRKQIADLLRPISNYVTSLEVPV